MIRLDVPRMSTEKCRVTVADALLVVDPGAVCYFDMDNARVAVQSKFPPSDFVEALEEVGYTSFIAQV
jgi:copper chaperone CopZ